MTALKDLNLAGMTVEYNTVQFGGADSDYRMTPPEFDLQITPVYDDANREVVHHHHALTVRTWVYYASEATCSAAMDTIKCLLLEPGRRLVIGGLGLGFVNQRPDIIWGPKPTQCTLSSVGRQAVELVWSCEFNSTPCCGEEASPTGGLYFKALNYMTNWAVDEVGASVRTVSGYVEMVQTRSLTNPSQVANVVDQFRDQINIATPNRFRRVSRSFTESADKTRLEFTAVDTEVMHDVLPQGIVRGSGDFSLSTVCKGGMWINLSPSLNLTVATADGVPYAAGLQKCLEIAKSKQDAMARYIGNQAIVGMEMSISRGMFAEANVTSLSINWLLAGEYRDVLAQSGLYEPLPDSNYQLWRQSVQHTWGNRGNRGLRSQASDDLVISVCDEVDQARIGNDAAGANNGEGFATSFYTIPTPTKKHSWLAYRVKVSTFRGDQQSSYKRAVPYIPEAETRAPPPEENDLFHPPPFTADPTTEDITEHHGLPSQLVRLDFIGVRVYWRPNMPRLLSVDNKLTEPEVVDYCTETEQFVDLGLPIHVLRGYRVYRVKDGIASQLKNQVTPMVPRGDTANGVL